jgi:hypothetical protein
VNEFIQGPPEPPAGDAKTSGGQPGSGVSSELNDAEARALRALSELESALADARSAGERESARRADVERALSQSVAAERQTGQELERVQEALRVEEAAAEEARQRAERSQTDVVAMESQLTQHKEAERRVREELESERAAHGSAADELEGLRAEVNRLTSALEEQRSAIGRLLDGLQGGGEPNAAFASPEPAAQAQVEEEAPTRVAEAPPPVAEAPPPVAEAPVQQEEAPEPAVEEAPQPAAAVEVEAVEPPPPPPPPPAPEVTRAANPVVQSTPPAGTPLPAQPPPGDLDELANACLGRSERAVVGGALERLPNRLQPGERPTHLGVGEYNGTTILVAVTDVRLLMLKLDEEMYQAFPFSEVSGAEVVRERFGRASLRIASQHGEIVVKGRRPEMLERVQRDVRERVATAHQRSPGGQAV